MIRLLFTALLSLLINTGVANAQLEAPRNVASCGNLLSKPIASFRTTDLNPHEISRIIRTGKCGSAETIPELVVRIGSIDDQAIQMVRNALKAKRDGWVGQLGFSIDADSEDWTAGIQLAELIGATDSFVAVREGGECRGACSLIYVAAPHRVATNHVALDYPSEQNVEKVYRGETISELIEGIYRTAFAEDALRYAKKNRGVSRFVGVWNLSELNVGFENRGVTERTNQRIVHGCGEAFYQRYQSARALRDRMCSREFNIERVKCEREIFTATGTSPLDVDLCKAPLPEMDLD